MVSPSNATMSARKPGASLPSVSPRPSISRRIGRGKTQGIGQRHVEHSHAIAHRAGHVEVARRPICRRLRAQRPPRTKCFAVELERRRACRRPAAWRRSPEWAGRRRATRAAAWPARHARRRRSSRTRRSAIRARPRSARARGFERPHGIEQMGEAGQARRHRRVGLRIGRHRVAERNAHAGGRELQR